MNSKSKIARRSDLDFKIMAVVEAWRMNGIKLLLEAGRQIRMDVIQTTLEILATVPQQRQHRLRNVCVLHD